MLFPFGRGITHSASRDRLERLIEERAKPGGDREIDILWDLLGQRRAVMFTDLSGFSRGVAEFGIIHFLHTIYELDKVVCPSCRIARRHIAKSRGGICCW